MTESRVRSAVNASPDSVFTGTKLSGRTHEALYFALMSSGLRPSALDRLASIPASFLICSGTTPTTAASVNVASSVPSRAMMRPRVVARRVIRTNRPVTRCGRIASGVQSIFHAAFSFSPVSSRERNVSRLSVPTRWVWKVTRSVAVARRGSGEPFAPVRWTAWPTVASSEVWVISSAMRGSRAMNPSWPTLALLSSVRRSHIAW